MLNIVKSAFGGKKILAGLALLSLVLGVAVPVWAAEDTAEVGVTVTPGVVSVTVLPASVDYGTLALSTSNVERSTAESATITATNEGTVTEDFTIKGANSNSTDWTLSSSPDATGTVAADQFAHRFDEGATFTDGEAATLDNTAYKELKSGVTAAGSVEFVLQMNMPTSDSTHKGAQSTTVTVLATEATP